MFVRNSNKGGRMNKAPLEKEEQIQFVDYCKTHGLKVISTQNGFKMPKTAFNFAAYSKTLTKMGLSKGFPDLIILEKNRSGTHEVLFIEMKRQKGGRISPEQKKWIQTLDDSGYCVGIAKGFKSAVTILTKYLEG